MLTGCVVGLALAVLIGLAVIGVAMAHAADDPYDDGDNGIYEVRLPATAPARDTRDESEASAC